MRMRISKAAVLATAAITLLAAPVDRAAAQGVPVYDATSVAQLIEQVTNQLEQLATMKAQLEGLTGARGIGAFMNAPEDIAARAAATNLSLMVMQTTTRQTRQDVLDYTARTIDFIVQVGRRGGRRGVLEIYMPALAGR